MSALHLREKMRWPQFDGQSDCLTSSGVFVFWYFGVPVPLLSLSCYQRVIWGTSWPRVRHRSTREAKSDRTDWPVLRSGAPRRRLVPAKWQPVATDLHFLTFDLPYAAKEMRFWARRMIFLGSDQVAVIVDNSLRRICVRKALRWLACEGRRRASSHGESLRSTSCRPFSSHAQSSTNVCIHKFKLYTAKLFQMLRTCCWPEPHTSFTS